jgi:hypothetical protein
MSMRRSTRRELRLLAVFVALALLAAQSGCVRTGMLGWTPPPAESTRSQFGRIGVTWIPEGPPPTFVLPAAGSCAGAGRGALIGTYFGIVLAGQLTSGAHGGGGKGDAYLLLIILAVALAIIPIAVLIGSVYGASAAHPPEEVEAAIAKVAPAAADPGLPRRIARRIFEKGRERTDENLVWLEPGSFSERCDSILEVGPLAVALVGPYQINPSLQLAASFPVRVIRASDSALLYEATWNWQSSRQAELFEWAQEEGKRVRQHLEGAGEHFSEQIIDRVFLLHLLPTDREWKGMGKP